MKKVPLARLFSLTGASAIGMASAFVLNVALAKVLSVEDYGVTRIATAFLVILSTVGQFAIHDALASSVARAANKDVVPSLFASASLMALTISAGFSLVAVVLILAVGYEPGLVATSLAVMCIVAPLVSLTQVYGSALQAVGSYRGVAVTQIGNGIIPLAAIVPASLAWGLSGWVGSRVLTGAMLLAIVLPFVYPLMRGGRPTTSAGLTIWSFSRVQVSSTLLSLVLMAGDVVILDRVSNDLSVVANYALGSLIVRAFGFIPTAIGRAYFVELADPAGGGTAARLAYLRTNLLVGVVVAFATALVAPRVLLWLVGPDYVVAGKVIVVWSLALVALFQWQAVSIINVATGHPRRSVLISLTGAVVGLPLLVYLGATNGAIGAAWACVLAYGAGALMGTFKLHSDGLLRVRPASK